MSLLFTPARIGTLTLSNRLVRSATAERLGLPDGRSHPRLEQMYRELARGGVGLLVTGHLYVHPAGRAHPQMSGIHRDDLMPHLRALAEAVHQEGGRIAAQINFGGIKCHPEATPEALGPSSVAHPALPRPGREMTEDEIWMVVEAFGQAARRAKEAGFDAVQVHAAHGYLIGQFLSPAVNHRADGWGGDLEGRMRLLREVARAVRAQVGREYPVFVKLGVLDDVEGGLTPEEGLRVVAALGGMGFDAVELSGGLSEGRSLNIRPGIRSQDDEAYFRPLARRARQVTDLPILLVGGLRSRAVMEDVLASGDADFISLSRPLICEPDLPRRLWEGQERSACISGNRCWPEKPEDEGIACKCEGVQRRA
ncbi:MAG: NADH:flavin oxidoreductase [Anaerolineae bacterium]|nr:NADH:flavin oxidoreductase [Anaerolineae bacterium]